MEQSETVSLRPKGRISRHRSPGRRTDLVGEVRATRQGELRQRGEETRKGTRREEEKTDRAEERSERGE